MKRKVNRVGTNTLTVSLPCKWTKKYKIKAGDEVDLKERGSSLEISSKASISLDTYTTQLNKTTLSNLKSIVGNAYKKGYTKIILEYKDNTILKDVQEVVDSLLGLEIIYRSPTRCEIRNIAQGLESEFNDLLRNCFILLLELSQSVTKDIKENKFERKADIIYRRDTITKNTDFLKRILNTYRRQDKAVIFQYLIVWTMEKTANEYKYIYNYCTKNKVKKLSPEIIKYAEDTDKLVYLYYQLLYQKKKENIEAIGIRKDEMIYSRLHKISTKISKPEFPVLYHLSSIVRRAWDMCPPYYGMSI